MRCLAGKKLWYWSDDGMGGRGRSENSAIDVGVWVQKAS